MVSLARRSLAFAFLFTACGDDGPRGNGGSTGEDETGVPTSSTITASGTITTTGPTTTDATDSDESSGSDTDGPDGPVVECNTDLQPASSGTCEVTSPGSNALVLRGNVLAPETAFHGGEVLVVGGLIRCVDCDCSGDPEYADATVVTCADGVISPGLINPHEHLSYANIAPIGMGPDRYEHRHHWRLGQGDYVQLDVPGGASEEEVLAQEFRFIMSGTTSIAGAAGEFGLARNLDIAPMLGGLPVGAANSDTFPLDDANGIQNDMGCDYGSDAVTNSDIETESAYLPHLSEGINAAALNEFTCTSMGAQDLIEPQSAVIHAIPLGPSEAQLLAEDLTRVIWSPRSNTVLYGNTAQVTMLDTMGVAVALGSDWVASGSMNMLRELRCADEWNDTYLDGYFEDVDLWRMVTLNAALATGTHTAIGKLDVGYVADIAVFAQGNKVDHQAVVEAELEDVVLVMRGGDVLYGDDDIVGTAALGGGDCETLEVCGVEKRACVAQDLFGDPTLADIRSAIEEYYPLFFCNVPDDEPTCVPSRDGYSGEVTGNDDDGDGLANANDNCPSVFNPVRPLEMDQGDADGDNAGDVCDVCPLDDTDSCAALDGNDVDADGEPNGTDNCPLASNPGQQDADDDGHGNACDACEIPNPGATPCPIAISIAAVRNPDHPDHPNEGSAVTITDAYVTAVRNTGSSRGFYLQDDSLEPWTGVLVFTGVTDPGVEVGNRVTVTAILEDYFGTTQLSEPQTTIDDDGTSLPFDPIDFADPADLATGSAEAEQWESMLVSIGAVEITVQNPDDPEDYDEFEVTGGLRVDDVIATDIDNTCAVGSTFSSIIAIHGWGFDNYKIAPRTPADIAGASCDPFD
jgi:imidazolonepropionase-like amidohydrolase